MDEVTVFIMGKGYRVPAGLTIMKAMEYAGYRLTRGCGCRGGYCGACATVYRLRGDYKLYADLACQTTVQDGMYIAQLPFTPAERPAYRLEELRAEGQTLLSLFPELARCVACNTCTKACPQKLEVMDAVQASLRGDIPGVAELTFDCVSCGLCTMRCPAEISHHHVWQLARRLNGAYLTPRAPHVAQRVAEVEGGKFRAELDRLMAMGKEELVAAYKARDIEP
ncbi:MAG: 2Fe-2S iron-sulfur cluster-binding protein [Candidatus Bipolaricaulota bacterium]|nr:2Fe-2S iron-sulfur cluster-binding protein [Candidatus Bipolaricaulota bacterium]